MLIGCSGLRVPDDRRLEGRIRGGYDHAGVAIALHDRGAHCRARALARRGVVLDSDAPATLPVGRSRVGVTNDRRFDGRIRAGDEYADLAVALDDGAPDSGAGAIARVGVVLDADAPSELQVGRSGLRVP